MGHLFTYVKTCERDHVKDFEQRLRVYNAVRYNAFFPVDPDNRVIMELQYTIRDNLLFVVFSFMIDFITFRLALAISFQGNVHTRCEETFNELNSTDIIRSEILTIVDQRNIH